jgi:hypothetical protein
MKVPFPIGKRRLVQSLLFVMDQHDSLHFTGDQFFSKHLVLQSKTFEYGKTLEIDGFLMMPDGLLLVECKSYIKSKDLKALEHDLNKCVPNANLLGRQLCAKRIMNQLGCYQISPYTVHVPILVSLAALPGNVTKRNK